ncbi:MAG: HAMP domain-containing protein [Paraburkholderia sp.]|uniref:methyl-accepting chemotaxis protein n=1 Tax=Paraburkholderia sp. TaxID=1926495 RepID=UPI00122BC784|nr:methyl-accepting chemotaxis protein [Paraburkholderia sp.]TAL93815.1 MAG: HAMP domain-containing protein [Paraburkholderia sp.]
MKDSLRTIKFKILLSFSVCIALMLAIGLVGLAGLAKIERNVRTSYSTSTLPLVQLSEVRASQLRVRVALRRMQALRTDSGVRVSVPLLESDLNGLEKIWTEYSRSDFADPRERQLAATIAHDLPTFKTRVASIVSMLKTDNFDAADGAIADAENLSDALSHDIEQDVRLNVDKAQRFADDSVLIFRTILGISIACVVIGALVAAAVSVYLTRGITRPLDQAVSIAYQISEGRLENRIVIAYRDEFGELLKALKKMDERLSDTVRGIVRSTESVSVASREIATGNMDLSARTEEQAASLEETAASMTELTETVRHNADNARQANVLAASATGMADTGNEVVQGMVRTIERISGSSSKISEITGVIEGIAFQTNILALNAAVEAARAGEEGRGFAVVAAEVRSLAQRSAAAAKEIKDLIGTSVEIIQDGSRQAIEVGSTMEQVKQAIKQVSDIVAGIAAASEEQSRGIEQVNRAVVQMDEVTQQNAALVEQAAAASQSLEEQAANLKGAVSAFAIGEARPSIAL